MSETRLRLYQTPIGIVLAKNKKDARHILDLAGAAPEAAIETVKRRRGVIFSVVGVVEVSDDDERFKWMGPDERRREQIKAKNLPPDYGPLFATDGGHPDEGEYRSEGSP